jgi:hypothetical protein
MVNKICEDDFCSSDVGILFIWLRSAFSKDEVLRDLSNFIAHSEGRDKGISFKYVESFVSNLIDVSKRGGTIASRPSLFSGGDIMDRLAKILEILQIEFEIKKLKSKESLIIQSLQELMEETEFRIKDPEVTRCYLRRSNGRMSFCVQAKLNGPVIKMGSGAAICSNLFD